MKSARDAGQSMQRVRVGMIGLAVVVLLLALASAVMRSASREAPVAAAGAPRTEAVANMGLLNQQEPGEPMAELGITPSTGNVQPAVPTR
jgi:hypothetical protein